MARLTDLGYAERIPGTVGFSNRNFRWKPGYSQKIFLEDPSLQDTIFRQHVVDLATRIQRYYARFIATQVAGITITLSGLVAGAHLGGMGGVKVFLETGDNRSDAFGTSVADYIKRFASYDLEL